MPQDPPKKNLLQGLDPYEDLFNKPDATRIDQGNPKFELQEKSKKTLVLKEGGNFGQGKIDYPTTDVRNQSYSGHPNLAMVSPDVVNPALRRGLEQSTSNVISTALPIPLLDKMKGVGAIGKIGLMDDVIRYAGKSIKALRNILERNLIGINKVFDIHDVRLKYHNNMILTLEESKLLSELGKGNSKNYKNIDPSNIDFSVFKDISRNESIKKGGLEEIFFGRDYPEIDIPSMQKSVSVEPDIEDIDRFFSEINIPRPKTYSNDFITYKGPYERTVESRKADKWLSDWFTNPKQKQKFLDYGGTENQWIDVLNSLENPIRAGKPYPKEQSYIKGIYVKQKASISTSSPKKNQIGYGVHEGTHKTEIVQKELTSPIFKELKLQEEPRSMLPKLYNDLTKAVRLPPEESYSEILRMRYNESWTPEMNITTNMLEKGLKNLGDGYLIQLKVKDKKKLLEIVNKAPVLFPFLIEKTVQFISDNEQDYDDIPHID